MLQQLGQWIREGEGRAQAGNHDGSLGVATVRVVGNGEKNDDLRDDRVTSSPRREAFCDRKA